MIHPAPIIMINDILHILRCNEHGTHECEREPETGNGLDYNDAGRPKKKKMLGRGTNN